MRTVRLGRAAAAAIMDQHSIEGSTGSSLKIPICESLQHPLAKYAGPCAAPETSTVFGSQSFTIERFTLEELSEAVEHAIQETGL